MTPASTISARNSLTRLWHVDGQQHAGSDADRAGFVLSGTGRGDRVYD
jgi:hypothetical protein